MPALALITSATVADGQTPASRPTLEVTRVSSPPVIDGKLDDPSDQQSMMTDALRRCECAMTPASHSASVATLLLALLPLLAACSREASLKPYVFQSPLVRLQRLEGKLTHLHTDQVRYRESDSLLFLCSYHFGVIDAKNPARMVYLAEGLTHTIPNDQRKPGCINLAWDDHIVYTTHRGNIDNPAFLTGWDITKTDPADSRVLEPVQLPVVQEPGISYEGVDVADGHIYVGLHANGLGVYRRQASNRIARIGTATGLTDAWSVTARSPYVFVSDGVGGLAIVDVRNPSAPKVISRAATGGLARSSVIAGNFAYVGAGSAGLVVVDLADLAAPKVVSKVAMPGTAVRVAYSAGRVFVAAWNDARAYDVSNPASPRFIGAVRLEEPAVFGAARDASGNRDALSLVTSRTFGIAAHDDFVFIGNWWLPYSYRLHPERVAPSLVLPETASLLDFGVVKAGETKTVPLEVRNQGTAPLTLFDNEIENSSFGIEPKQARIAAGATATLSVIFKPRNADAVSGKLRIHSDDPDTPLRTANLVANRPGVGVGTPLPETRVQLVDGSDWSSATARHKVQLLAYFATF